MPPKVAKTQLEKDGSKAIIDNRVAVTKLSRLLKNDHPTEEVLEALSTLAKTSAEIELVLKTNMQMHKVDKGETEHLKRKLTEVARKLMETAQVVAAIESVD